MARKLTALILILATGASAPAAEPAIDFSRQVRPILAENCFACHGPDARQRKADLRLDTRDAARAVIKPGDATGSLLIQRITAGEPGQRMPPAKTGKQLSPSQVELLRRWIDAGASWSEHWALVPPRQPPLPNVRDRAWVRNEIDRFILARLESAGLRTSVQADRYTLIRRLSLDLAGLPPTVAEVDAFVNDPDPNAYEKAVDRLLASPHYGEKMGQDWLDLARFGDTNGYQDDATRPAWPYRDHVIAAFNANQPFDQFTIEALAGDLLPGATVPQKVASGFNRMHRQNEEGGSDPEEFRVAYAVDRTNTTATVWLGLTLGCAQCHDHKYDPVSQKEYYQLLAFFNNIKGEVFITKNPSVNPPQVRLATAEQEALLKTLDERIAGLEKDKKEELATARKEREALERGVLKALIMEEMEPRRPTHVLLRGDFRHKGEAVAPGVPAALPPLPPEGRRDRLALARWLVSPENPLTARVAVNRLWKQIFGRGLVPTAEDFGVQGAPPTHPELLDWLATRFVADGWDVKAFQRRIVLSATYRQGCATSPALQEADPGNRLLARGARYRLSAEEVRDGALAISGLLVRRVGGPSVHPYQPANFFADKSKDWSWPSTSGPDLYRRGLYTFWRRTSPYPSLQTFDAPSRGECVVSRPRTNTPLQALVTLNDPVFVEAARVFGQRILQDGGAGIDEKLTFAFRTALARPPTPPELQVLRRLYDSRLDRYRADPKAAAAVAAHGKAPRPADADAAELAAWTMVAATLLNLDETITRE